MKKLLFVFSMLFFTMSMAHADINLQNFHFKGSAVYSFIKASNSADKGVNSLFGKQLKQESGIIGDHRFTKLILNYSNQLNSGLMYGLNFQYRPLNNDAHTVSGFLSSDSTGKIMIGRMGSAFDEFVPGGNTDVEAGLGNDASSIKKMMHSVVYGIDGDHLNSPPAYGNPGHVNQIAYYTPNFFGFQIGISWAPDPNVKADQVPGNSSHGKRGPSSLPTDDSGYAHMLTQADGVTPMLNPETGKPLTVYYNPDLAESQRNNTTVAIKYEHDIGAINVDFGAAYAAATSNKGPIGHFVDHTTQFGNHNHQAVALNATKSYGVGLALTGYGLSFSSQYANSGKSGCIKNPTSKFAGCKAGNGFGVGMGYQLGNLYTATGVQYNQDRLDGAIKEKRTMWNVGAEYTVVKGFGIFSEVIRDDSSNGLTPEYFNMSQKDWDDLGLKNKNKAWIYLVGTRMYF